MPRQDVLETIRKYTDLFRVTKGKDFRLKDFDPGDTRGLKMDKQEAAELLERGSEWLAMEQDILYAQDSWALLLVFQAMDAPGKDGTIKHVMSRVNPQGVDVFSFKQASDEELSHDFLWRYAVKIPQRGRIGIFNRSYYEEVLVVRVHQELLKAQKLPPKLVDKRIWDERLADIARFEDYLHAAGDSRPQVLPQLVSGGAEEAIHGPSRQAGQELEVLRFGRARTPLLGQLHARLRGGDLRDRVEGCALVRGARRQQVVLPPRCRGGDCRGG
jgi:hypothetical protein